MGVTPWGQEGLQGVAVSAWGPPSASCPAWPHLLCPSMLAPGWRAGHSVVSRGGSGVGSFEEGLPHTCPLHTQPNWGPRNPTPTRFPLTLGPWCQASPCSSHPGPGLAAGVPLVSGLSAQQKLFLLRPQRILWAPQPRPWVPQDASVIPASVVTGPARGTRAHVPASPSHPQVLFISCQLLSSLWPSAWPLRRLGGFPRVRMQGQEHQFQEGAAGGQGAAVEPQGVAAR